MLTVLLACSNPTVPNVSAAPAVAPVAPAAPTLEAPPFTDNLLPFAADREALTVAYLRAHRLIDRGTAPVCGSEKAACIAPALTGDAAADTHMTPRVIVLHWTAGPTAASARNTFASARLSGRAELADAGALNVGAHFLVDRDGTIERLFPEDRVVRHTIGLNHVAIGVENVGGGDQWPLTNAQVEANAALIRWLTGRYPITHLIGHLEYRGLEGHPYFEEQDPKYRTTKSDPGAPFMTAVRAKVAELGLLGK